MRVIFLFIILPLYSLAQQPVKESLIPLYNNVPALPVSLADIRSQVYDAATGSCSTEKIGLTFSNKIGSTIQAIQSNGQSYSMQPDSVMVEELQNMTPEQQREWAIQYAMKQQTSANTTMRLPSSAENELTNEYMTLNASESAMIDKMNAEYNQLTMALNEKLEHFRKQREEFVLACSKLKWGIENPEPDYECVQKGERNYREWLASYSSEWFEQVKQLNLKYANQFRTRITPTENLIISHDYFLNATNERFTHDAAYVQLLMLNEDLALGFMIGDAWEKGCSMLILLKESYERAGETF